MENVTENAYIRLNPLSPAGKQFLQTVDPDETADHEPSHQDLHCLPFSFDF